MATATARSRELEALARRVVAALPADVAREAVLTGSVSRGVADDVSDIEMLIVTPEPRTLDGCRELARAAGLHDLDTWGPPGGPGQCVSGYRDGVPIETIWWPLDHAEAQIDVLLRGERPSTADALVHGVALRTEGRLADWQRRLAVVPDELAVATIEQAAQRWGGYAPAAVLTLLRPGDRLELAEWLVDGATRVHAIVCALNRVWQPTSKRLAERVAGLAVAPPRLAERIEETFAGGDGAPALRVLTALELDTVHLAPDGPNVNRARVWLAEALEILRA